MDLAGLTDALPIERRLALAYTPARARGAVLALFALDGRLAAVVGAAREPVLGQIKLAWWREQLRKAPAARPQGEPLLQLVGIWGEHGATLVALVDGWEQVLGDSAEPGEGVAAVAHGRAQGAAALAELLGHGRVARAAGRAAQGWTVAEFAATTAPSEGLAGIAQLLTAQDWSALRLPRDLRALAVLYGLARRSRGTRPLLSGPIAGLAAIRLGLLGI